MDFARECFIGGDFVKIADNVEKAYRDFIIEEKEYNFITYSEFVRELQKGYGESKYVPIARCVLFNGGVYYDNDYCG